MPFLFIYFLFNLSNLYYLTILYLTISLVKTYSYSIPDNSSLHPEVKSCTELKPK